jgi:hypothetical protein
MDTVHVSRRASRTDRNQPEIVSALRRLGASVEHIHTLGRGVPDLLVGYRGRNLLVELKDGELPPSKQALTEDEARWHSEWKGEVVIIRSVSDLLGLLSL